MSISHTLTAYVGILGLAISAIGYLINARGRSAMMITGMALLVIGYSLLVVGEVDEISLSRKENHGGEPKLNDYALAGYVFVVEVRPYVDDVDDRGRVYVDLLRPWIDSQVPRRGRRRRRSHADGFETRFGVVLRHDSVYLVGISCRGEGG